MSPTATGARLAAFVSLVATACASARAVPPASPAPAQPRVAAAPAPAPAPAVAPPPASGPPPEDQAAATRSWHALSEANKVPEARALCESWLASPIRWLAAEGHKCLANVGLMGPKWWRREGGKHGGITGPDHTRTDQAIDHLTKAIALAPEDLSTHQGRLHVAISYFRPDRAPKLLADSLQTYTGPDALPEWLAYAQELWQAGSATDGLEFMRVLEKKYPDDHRVVGNVGTFLIVLDRRDEALPYLRRAVELAPKDAIDNWNLGRFYEKQGDMKSAEPLFRKAIALEADRERRQDMTCNLARFLSEHPASHADGCAMARKQCDIRPPSCKK